MTQKNENPAAGVNAALSKGEKFFVQYKKQIIIAISAVILIILGAILYSTLYAAPREEEASTAMAKGQEYFAAQQFDVALNGDNKGYKGFAYVADEYSCTKAGNLAKLYSGLCYAYLGKWNEAIDNLEDFSSKDDAMVSPSALFALGNAYANIKEYDKAVSLMKKAADKADSKAKTGRNISVSPTFLISAAQILESQGKKDEALEIYKDLKKYYPGSYATQDIDRYIEHASVK